MKTKQEAEKPKQSKPSLFERLYKLAMNRYEYATKGVWYDPRRTFGVRLVKMLNVAMRSFFDTQLQSRSMALTYSTMLAFVPALALLFAIGRGFGFQNLLQDSLFNYFPSQRHAIEAALTFVDKYLQQASQGIFVGIGIVLLLWTLISLLGNIEESFNKIWGVKHNRTIYRKITDYTSILLIIPVLMVCSSGVSILMATMGTTLASKLPFLTPLVNSILDFSPVILVWLAFTLTFMLIPNTKVEFKYSAVAGLICAVAFEIVQMLLLNGQIYVSKYNAIYGSFAFLPILLIWLQLSWLILLFGCVLTYSAQNVFGFNYLGDIGRISENYMKSVAATVMTIVLKRYESGKEPFTQVEISSEYNLPISLINRIVAKLHECGIVFYVLNGKEQIGIAPAVDNDKFTLTELFRRIDETGENDFIPQYAENYAPLLKITGPVINDAYTHGGDVLIRDLPLPELPLQQQEVVKNP